MPRRKVRSDLEQRWHTAVGVYANASLELLKGPAERFKEINDAYEVARREFFPEADSCPQMEDSTESWLMSLASDQ